MSVFPNDDHSAGRVLRTLIRPVASLAAAPSGFVMKDNCGCSGLVVSVVIEST